MNNRSQIECLQRLGRISLAYTPYGFQQSTEIAPCLGFNGQWFDRRIGGYLLGSGARLFIPSLMRFSSADSLSPFGEGGVNAYIYCGGDPVNYSDPSGKNKIKTGFGAFMEKNNVPLAQRTRAKKYLREPMQFIGKQEGQYKFTAKISRTFIEVKIENGQFSYQTTQGFDLLAIPTPTRYQKHGIEVSLDKVPLMQVDRGFSSKMDLVPRTNIGPERPLTTPILQPTAVVHSLRSDLPFPPSGESEA